MSEEAQLWFRKLERAMRARGSNALRLGTALGIDSSRFTKFRQGTGMPTFKQVREICSKLDISMDWLADDDIPIDCESWSTLSEDAGLPAGDLAKVTPSRHMILVAIDAIGDEEVMRLVIKALMSASSGQATRPESNGETPPKGCGEPGQG